MQRRKKRIEGEGWFKVTHYKDCSTERRQHRGPWHEKPHVLMSAMSLATFCLWILAQLHRQTGQRKCKTIVFYDLFMFSKLWYRCEVTSTVCTLQTQDEGLSRFRGWWMRALELSRFPSSLVMPSTGIYMQPQGEAGTGMQKTWFLWCFPFPLPTREESKSRFWTLAFPLLLLPHGLEFQLTNIISIELGVNKISKDMMSSKDFCKLTHKKAFGLYLSSSYPSQQNWRYLKDLLFPGAIIHCKPSCKLKISYLLSFFFFGYQKVLSFPASDYCACFSFLQDSTNQTKNYNSN